MITNNATQPKYETDVYHIHPLQSKSGRESQYFL